jgi:hypothetical protein
LSPPKGGIPYQKAGEEQAYFACPVPGYEGVVSRGADEIVSTLKEDGDVPFDLDTRVHSDIAIANDLDPFPYVKPENNFAFLGVDLSTETIWKDRGSDFNGMARDMYTWRYYATLVGFLELLRRFARRAQSRYRWAMYKVFRVTQWTGEHFSVESKLKGWWQKFLGRRITLSQRFGVKTVARHFMVKKGWIKPKLREVEWPAAEELRQADGSYLAGSGAARPACGPEGDQQGRRAGAQLPDRDSLLDDCPGLESGAPDGHRRSSREAFHGPEDQRAVRFRAQDRDRDATHRGRASEP